MSYIFFVFVCLAPTIVIPLAPPAYGSVSIARTGEVGPNSKHALRVLATAILTFDHALWRLAPWFALESLPLSFLDPKTLVRRVLLLRSLHFSPRCCHVGVVLWRESTVSFLTPLSGVVIGYAKLWIDGPSGLENWVTWIFGFHELAGVKK